jgi:hypothetical protein
MFSDVHNHIINKIDNAVIEKYPYTHLVVDNIFPKDFYQKLVENPIPNHLLYNLKSNKRVHDTYSDSRYVLSLKPELPELENNIKDLYQNLSKYFYFYFKNILLKKFNLTFSNLHTDFLYVRDFKSYSLGPHTDKTSKVLTSLIYLPKSKSEIEMGTSIYLPKDRNFRCQGGPHHNREKFDLYKTIPYEPNKMFCFVKSDVSFHGVEPITKEIERNLLIFDLQRLK